MQHLYTFFSHRDSRTTGWVFASNSVLFGGWATRLPDIQNQLTLTEGQLGLALLCVAVGGLVVMPVVPYLMNRIGTGRATYYSTLLYALATILPSIAPGFYTLLFSFLIVGFGVGTMDVSMNAAAAAIEKRDNLNIMSSCHGMFSLGGFVGSILASTAAAQGVSVSAQMIVMVAIVVVVNVILLRPTVIDLPSSDTDGQHFALPKGPVLLIALVGFAIMVTEGAVADWSSVYVRNTLDSGVFVGGLGFAGFWLGMTIGRFSGDRIVPIYGAKRVVATGSLLGFVGLLLAVGVATPIAAIIGFTLVGVGLANVVPVLFRTASRIPGVPSGIGVASVTTAGIFGFLIGPPLIGFLADEFGLRIALGVIALMTLLGALISFRTRLFKSMLNYSKTHAQSDRSYNDCPPAHD